MTTSLPKYPYFYEMQYPDILQYFEYTHLNHPQVNTSALCKRLANDMATDLPPGPEVIAGLRHLLEAKDCFVRATLKLPR